MARTVACSIVIFRIEKYNSPSTGQLQKPAATAGQSGTSAPSTSSLWQLTVQLRRYQFTIARHISTSLPLFSTCSSSKNQLIRIWYGLSLESSRYNLRSSARSQLYVQAAKLLANTTDMPRTGRTVYLSTVGTLLNKLLKPSKDTSNQFVQLLLMLPSLCLVTACAYK